MTCKDCFHYEVCQFLKCPSQQNEKEIVKYCYFFEDKSMLVQLPCKVGDTVYYTHPEHLDGEIESYQVTGFCFDKDCCRIRTYNPKGVIIYFYFDFIGKTVFLTKEEAEKALKGEEE